MSLYRLDASIRVESSHSRASADIVEQEWRNTHPDAPITRRHVGIGSTPTTAWATAVFAGRTPEVSRTAEQKAALALAATLTDELVAADALLFAVPLYNVGVSQHFKTWVDLVITDPRMAAGAQPLLAGKPAVLVTVHGGNYRPGPPARDGIMRPGGCGASSPTSGTWTCRWSRPSSPMLASIPHSTRSRTSPPSAPRGPRLDVL